MLVALRDCIKASNVLSLSKSDGYTPLTFKEAFFLATLGGCQGKLSLRVPGGNTCRMFGRCLHTIKCLNGLAPSYLSDLVCTSYIPRRNLRSANSHCLLDVRYSLRNYCFRSFSVASPQLWNDMPVEVRSWDSLNDFEKKLKPYFLGKRFYQISPFIFSRFNWKRFFRLSLLIGFNVM